MRTFTFVAALSTVIAPALPAYGLSMKADDFIVPFERNSAMLTDEAQKAIYRAVPFDKTTEVHFRALSEKRDALFGLKSA
jgi:hypothetical protein